MPRSQLSRLQRSVLIALAGPRPVWTLTGGGALAGVHLGHRTTRDLDLFWRGATSLGTTGDAVVARLRAEGFRVDSLQTSPAFQQLRVADADEVVVVDLVADPVPSLESPVEVKLGDVVVQVDSAYEILVNKLCALLGRSELRDLIDVRALLLHGLELERALADAPKKDSGFSPVTLAWVLKQQALAAMAEAVGLEAAATDELLEFRAWLVERVMASARPSP